jgi:hypothetical protein
MSSKQPLSSSSSKSALRNVHKSGSQNNNFDHLKCDSCNNTILSANHADHHVQIAPCNHNICMLCVIKANISNTPGCFCQVGSCNTYIASCQYFRAGSPGEIIRNERGDGHIMLPSFDDLGTDVLANIFGFLGPMDIMRARQNKKMREAAKKTIVPPTEFRIESVRDYNLTAAMTTALPNLQQLSICYLEPGHKFSDGEDPYDDEAERTAGYDTHEIDIISNFRELRSLEIMIEIDEAPLNGRYPSLFNFPLLQKLTIVTCYIEWDLEMLGGLPLLEELDTDCWLTGNLSSLRVLKDTLKKARITRDNDVEGNFMDLADFPHLRVLNLSGTNVKGDIRDISEHDFLSLESLTLPEGVYGASGHELQRISDAPDFIHTFLPIMRRRPNLRLTNWYGRLSKTSPDFSPMYLVFVQAGPRIGYRWQSGSERPRIRCEVNWLDPKPSRGSSDFEKYSKALNEIERKVKGTTSADFTSLPLKRSSIV